MSLSAEVVLLTPGVVEQRRRQFVSAERLDGEVDAAESAVDDAPIDGQATEAIETTTEEKTTLTTAKTGESAKHMPRKAAVEKLATA